MIAKTKYGLVEGKMTGRFYTFLGVPFAKAPVGELRWKAPVAPDPWSGVYDCTDYGCQSLQDGSFREIVTGCKGLSEDCLNLNIWTPGLDGAKRPVVVMYSGGGSTNGGNNHPVFSGTNFCKDREVVMVFANFRLGMLGFLYLGHLLGEEYQASGSCGLMDQVFALKWVRENIENFGGDPDNITIMGQSAGGKTVSNMMLSPLADGMYRRVIAMSGANQVIRDLETSRAITNRFLKVNGIEKKDAGKLLTLSGKEILELQGKYYAIFEHVTGPTYDGITLPIKWEEERLHPGAKKGLSVLMGHTREEFAAVPMNTLDDEAASAKLNILYGNNGSHVYSVYREWCKHMPRYIAWQNILTQYNYGYASVHFANRLANAGANVWCYRWDYPGSFRAAHGTDLPYVCGYAEETENPKPEHCEFVAKLMNDSFMNFIMTGNPQTKDTMDWQPYTDAGEGTRMYFSDYPSAEAFSLADNYDPDFPDSQLILTEEG